MNQANQIDRDLYLYDSQDGLGDIFTGLILLSFGVGILSGMFWLSGIWVPVLVPVWQDVKKRIALRRGDIQLSPTRLNQARIRLAMLVAVGVLILLLGVVTFLLFSVTSISPEIKTWLSEYFELTLGGFIALLLAVVGAIVRTGRFYLYASLALAVFITGYVANIGVGISMTVLGGVILLVGLFILIQFLREHPVQERN
jgi:hypothetical protein